MAGFRNNKIAVAGVAAVTLLLDIADVSFLGLPLSILCLAAFFGLIVFARPEAPGAPCWLRVLFLSSLCLGLVPLAGGGLGDGARELVQAFAVFGIAWTSYAALTDEERRKWLNLLGLVGAGLVIINIVPVRLPLSDARLSLLMCLLVPFIVSLAIRSRFSAFLVLPMLTLYAFSSQNSPLMITGLVAVGAFLFIRRGGLSLFHWVSFAAVMILALCLLGSVRKDSVSWRRAETGNLKRLLIEYEAVPGAVTASPVVGHGLGRYRKTIGRYLKRFPDPDDNRVTPDTNSIYAVLAVEAGLPASVLLLTVLAWVTWRGLHNDSGTSPELVAATGALVVSGLFTVPVARGTGILVGSILGMTAAATESTIPPGFRTWITRCSVFALCLGLCLGAGLLPGRDERGAGLTVMKPSPRAVSDYWLIEAEDTIGEPIAPLAVTDANDASGNRVLKIPLGAGKGKGEVVYAIPKLPRGTYTVWARVLWHDGCANSIGCVIGRKQMVISDEIFKRWHWVPSVQTIVLGAGDEELQLRNTEDGIMVDQLILSPDPRFVPHGIVKDTSLDQ
ncbi:MAG: hypothetical protein QGH15_06810 [Kiritimatiellia bacterium]|jgi:hypothetical protein|nr:hypothetical protein [Kiritimatiellia bacterium]